MVFVDTEEEFNLLCKGVQRFKDFNLALEVDETADSSAIKPP